MEELKDPPAGEGARKHRLPFLHADPVKGTLAALLATAVLSLSGWLDRLENSTYDIYVRAVPARADTRDVALILVDQASLDWASRENSLPWPWPREIYAHIIDYCARAGAASLALDILMTEPSRFGVGDDHGVAEAGEAYGRLVLPVFLGQGGQDRIWPQGPQDMLVRGLRQRMERQLPPTAVDRQFPAATEGQGALPTATLPTPEVLRGAALLGNVQHPPDSDGIYRRIRPVQSFDGTAVPSLFVAAWMAAHPGERVEALPDGLRLGGRMLPLDAHGNVLLRYHDESSLETWNAASFVRSALQTRDGQPPDIPPEAVRGKHVLMGLSAPGLMDLRPTPLSAVTPGVAIHAQALLNVLHGGALRPLPPLPAWLLAALFTLGVSCLCLRLPSLRWGGLLALALALPVPLGLWAHTRGLALPVMLFEASALLGALCTVFLRYAHEWRQRRFVQKAFNHYLSPVIIEQLMRHPEALALGGEKRTITIFFSDLENFTSTSRHMDALDIIAFLNAYLREMTAIILEEGGCLDKYVGDAIVAFWNAPLRQPDHAARAVRAALRCQDRAAALREEFQRRYGVKLHVRMGLHTGEAVVGNVGSEMRFDYTMIGAAVNLASRLEGANKYLKTYTMISDDTMRAAQGGGEFAFRDLGRVLVSGESRPVHVWEPGWKRDEARFAPFNAALQRFHARDFAGAEAALARCSANSSVDAGNGAHDGPSAVYRELCRRYAAEPEQWQGHMVLGGK